MTNPSVSFAPSLRRTVNSLADKAVNVYRRHQTVLALIVACFPAVASVRILFDLVQMLRFIWDDLLNGDALIFLTMGRGILNGLLPYVDLFESKPPGVFYLSAFSLYLTNGVGVLRLVEAAGLLFLPGVCAFIARPGKRMTGFLLGGLLALRSFENAGGLASEIFGILPTSLFVMSLFVGNRGWKWNVLRGLFLLGGIAIREPLLLGMLAAVLLVARSWRDLWELFVLPLVVALAVGCLGLLMCGILQPFMTSYLPAMFLERIAGGQQLAGGVVAPIAWRILWVHRFFASLTEFSTMPLLGYVAGFLWFLLVVGKEKTDWKTLVLTCITVIGGIAAIQQLFVLTVVLSKTAHVSMTTWQTLSHRSFWPISLAYLVGGILYLLLLGYLGKRNRRSLLHVIFGLAAVLLLNFAVGIGGYLWNYMVFAVPALLACFIAFLRTERRWWPVALMLVVAALAYYPDRVGLYSQQHGKIAHSRQNSAKLDAILDACGHDSYVFAGRRIPRIRPGKALSHRPDIHTVFSGLPRIRSSSLRRDVGPDSPEGHDLRGTGKTRG